MKDRRRVKYVHEGRYVAEVEVDLIDSDASWSPCLSLDDAYKLDEVRMALKKEDIAAASNFGRIYVLKPLAG